MLLLLLLLFTAAACREGFAALTIPVNNCWRNEPSRCCNQSFVCVLLLVETRDEPVGSFSPVYIAAAVLQCHTHALITWGISGEGNSAKAVLQQRIRWLWCCTVTGTQLGQPQTECQIHSASNSSVPPAPIRDLQPVAAPAPAHQQQEQ